MGKKEEWKDSYCFDENTEWKLFEKVENIIKECEVVKKKDEKEINQGVEMFADMTKSQKFKRAKEATPELALHVL